MNTKRSIRQWLVVCSFFFYGIACALPVFREDYTPGITALLRGWMGLLGGSPVFLSWLANITYFISLLVPFSRRETKTGFAIATLLLGLCFLAVKKIPVDEGGQNLDVSPGIAFYVWMGSFLLLFISLFTGPKKAGN